MVFFMAIIIIFMTILLIYSLIWKNKFIIGTVIVGLVLYFLALQPILTEGGSIREHQLKKQWGNIVESPKEDYASYLTLLKTTFAHRKGILEEISFYSYSLKLRQDLKQYVESEEPIKNLTSYDPLFHKELIGKVDYYHNLMESHKSFEGFPKYDEYTSLHESLGLLISGLEQISNQNENMEFFLAQLYDKPDTYSKEEVVHLQRVYFQEYSETLGEIRQNLILSDEILKKATHRLEKTITKELN